MKNNLRKEVQWLIEEKYKGKRTAQARKDIARLERGEHIDYVIGWVDFLGCKIDLSKKPLIPRPETEYWVRQVIRELRGQNFEIETPSLPALELAGAAPTPYDFKISPSSLPLLRILDIFAGSGCIGIAILKHIPKAQVDFAEKDRSLLKQIKINAKLNGIGLKRYRVFQSDIFSNIKGRYDYIFANPPYVAETRKANVQKSVLDQEPHNAVFGGKDGLRHIKKFLADAKMHLKPNGKIYMEFDSFQKQAIAKLLKEFGYAHFEFFKDQYGKWRYVSV